MLWEIKRVRYGSEETPIEDREYKPTVWDELSAPVGTIEDWKEFVMDRPDFDGLRIIELDGTIKEIEVNNPILEE